MKILVVDDSAVMRKILTRTLNTAGYDDISEAGDGAEGFEKATAAEYDLILMDWNMPKMTGIECLKALREKGVKTPIIMVTTEAEKARVIEAIRSGANNYVVKPFKPEAIAEKIKQTLKL